MKEEDYAVTFGGYEWLILKKYDDHALVVMADVMQEERPYHKNGGAITWADCTLRQWLNGEFYQSFTPEERERILDTNHENLDNVYYGTDGGVDTTDKIFLLSAEEAEKYMTRSERTAKSWWWLRSPGDYQYDAAGVNSDGDLYASGGGVYSVRGGQ